MRVAVAGAMQMQMTWRAGCEYTRHLVYCTVHTLISYYTSGVLFKGSVTLQDGQSVLLLQEVSAMVHVGRHWSKAEL